MLPRVSPAYNSVPATIERLATFGNFWQLLATFGNSWKLSAALGNSWKLLENWRKKYSTSHYFDKMPHQIKSVIRKCTKLGADIMQQKAPVTLSDTFDRRWRSHFGCSPEICSKLWLILAKCDQVSMKSLLWVLFFWKRIQQKVKHAHELVELMRKRGVKKYGSWSITLLSLKQKWWVFHFYLELFTFIF